MKKKLFLLNLFVALHSVDKELVLPDNMQSISEFKKYVCTLTPEIVLFKLESHRISQRTGNILHLLTTIIDSDKYIDKESAKFDSEISKLLRAMRFKTMFQKLEDAKLREIIFTKIDPMSEYLKTVYQLNKDARLDCVTADIDNPDSFLNWAFFYQDTGYARRALVATYYGLAAVGKFFRYFISQDDL